jgi:hypothetical protein
MEGWTCSKYAVHMYDIIKLFLKTLLCVIRNDVIKGQWYGKTSTIWKEKEVGWHIITYSWILFLYKYEAHMHKKILGYSSTCVKFLTLK